MESRHSRPRPAAPLSLGALRHEGGAALRAALAGPPEEAVRWLDAAARYGLVEAQLWLGQCLLDGRGTPPAPVRALGWFRVAARAGYPPAMNMLGRCLERGWGCRPDPAAAVAWYREAAAEGEEWAQYNLANALLRGRGVPADRAGALHWFRRAAASGHAKSMNLVGRFHEEGWECRRDPAAAARCYRHAAEEGDERGAYNWATCLARAGRGGEAATWFLRAARAATPDLLAVMAETLAGQPAFAAAFEVVSRRRAATRRGSPP
jgi:TPR repeat protein